MEVVDRRHEPHERAALEGAHEVVARVGEDLPGPRGHHRPVEEPGVRPVHPGRVVRTEEADLDVGAAHPPASDTLRYAPPMRRSYPPGAGCSTVHR